MRDLFILVFADMTIIGLFLFLLSVGKITVSAFKKDQCISDYTICFFSSFFIIIVGAVICYAFWRNWL